MAAAARRLPRRVLAPVLLGGVLLGGWTAYMWYIYDYDSGLAKRARDAAYKAAMTVKITPLRGGLFMLQGDGGNVTALSGDDGVLIVDSDLDWMAEKIDAALKTLTDKPVRYVINTHFHDDHRGGNGHFHRLGAEIIAHRKTLENMKADTDAPAGPDDLPTITFQDEYHLSFGGEDILVRYVPNAHTDSDVFAYFPVANVLAAGDAFSFGCFPYISTGTHGTIDGHLAGQEQLLALVDDETLIVPGHGDLADRKGLAETSWRLGEIRDYVSLLKSMGISVWMSRAFYPTCAWRADWRQEHISDRFFLSLVYKTVPD